MKLFRQISRKSLPVPILGAWLAGASVAQAAVIVGSVTGPVDTSYNLTTIGTTDWAYWNTSSNPSSRAPTNEKSGGSLIGDMFPVGGDNLRGSSSSTQPDADFTFSDGTSTPSGSVSRVTGLFNSGLDATNVGAGLSFILPTTETYTLTFWVAVFDGAGRFTATLPGASTYSDLTAIDSATGSNKDTYVYTLTVTPDNPNDVLTVNMVLNADGGGPSSSSHVAILAAAVSVVPEPGALALALVPGLAWLGGRRKRNTRN